MARYRLYKNGIFGHRYKGYFIIKDETEEGKKFSILGADKIVLKEDISDYADAEWEIDKVTASPKVLQIIQDLYSEEIYMLSKFFAELMEKDNGDGLTSEEKDFYAWVKKIRRRKAANKPY